MAMEEDLVARLAGDAAIGAAIGRDADDVPSISWGLPLQGASRPWLVLSKVSPGRDYTHGGADGLDGPRVQFDVLADTDVATATLARAVCTVMQQAAEVGGTRFHEGFLEAETWIDEGEQEGGGAVFRVSQDFTFYHEEI
jgi:hypothetical protein